MPANVPKHLLSRIINQPLLLEPSKADAILAILLSENHRVPTAEMFDEPKEKQGSYECRDGIALINVSGTLVHKSSWMTAWSGLMSYDSIHNELNAALDDDTVKRMLLLVDSPGGEVAGAFDLAAAIHEAAKEKPIDALAEDLMASAAYLVSSAANNVYTTQSGITGSIGVVCMHVDQSKYDAERGLKYTAIHAGARKIDGNPHEPLNAEGRATIQAEIDTYYGLFVKAVAKYRGLSEATIRGTEARTFIGSDAVTIGLVTGVTTRTALISGYRATSPGHTEGVPMPKETGEVTTPSVQATGVTVKPIEDRADVIAARFPDATKAIQTEATTAERNRLAEIDDVAKAEPGNTEMAAEAKAEGWTPGAFAVALCKAKGAEMTTRREALGQAEEDLKDLQFQPTLTVVPKAPAKLGTDATDEQIKAVFEKNKDVAEEFERLEVFAAAVKNEGWTSK